MKYRILYVIRISAIFILALYILLILCTGGYTYTVLGITIKFEEVHVPIILLVLLVHLRVPLRYSTFA
jgi:hypothetical protein